MLIFVLKIIKMKRKTYDSHLGFKIAHTKRLFPHYFENNRVERSHDDHRNGEVYKSSQNVTLCEGNKTLGTISPTYFIAIFVSHAHTETWESNLSITMWTFN